jgi:photosystem II oxygen-evolving enhancer protein 2
MLKRLAIVLLIVLSLALQSCVSTVAGAGLKSYVNSYKGYEFLYPNGWLPVKVSNGPDLVLHDIVEETENVSVIISDVAKGKTLAELGTPSEVGYRLSKGTIASSSAGRSVELVDAQSRQVGDETYYLLEYVATLPNQTRHNLASVVVRRGQLFTFNLSTTEKRWEKAEDRFRQVVKSFSVY